MVDEVEVRVCMTLPRRALPLAHRGMAEALVVDALAVTGIASAKAMSGRRRAPQAVTG